MRNLQGGKRAWRLCLAGWLLAGPSVLLAEDQDSFDSEPQALEEYDEAELGADDPAEEGPEFSQSVLQVGSKKVRVFTNENPVEPADLEADADAEEMPQPPEAVEPADAPYDGGEGWSGEGEEGHYRSRRGMASHAWVRNEYLHWFTTGSETPPLVTTGPATDPAAVLGDPDTIILIGDTELNDGNRSGYRLSAGVWFDECQRWALYGDFFDMGTQGTSESLTSNGNPVLARPFIDISDPEFPVSSSELIAFPGIIVGTVNVDAEDVFRGAGMGLRHNLWCHSYCTNDCSVDACTPVRASCRIDGLMAYRHYHLGDRLTIRENLVVVDAGGADPLGTMIDVTDQWRTTNDFHGADIGAVAEFRRGRWSMEVLGKVALGNDRQTLTINGQTDVTVPGQATVRNVGGLLALNNIGTYTREEFVAIPQVEFTVGCQLTCRLRAYAGYNFFYWANILRAGEQVDLFIDTTQLPPGDPPGTQPQPGTQPPVLFDSNFWAHGVTAGIEYRF